MIELRVFRYRLPLRPITLARREYRERQGLLLCDAETQSRWGEAAPLPHFSRETLDDVVAELRQAEPPYSLPSLRFAMEMLNHDLDAPPVQVNRLLAGPAKEVVSQATRCAELDFAAIKLKVGASLGTVYDCAAVVQAVRRALRPNQQLRLDANRAWSLDDAIAFGKLVADVDIEYIEEPTAAAADLEEFWQQTRVPYALDETLRESFDLSRFAHAAALIVKPMLHGGHDAIELLRHWNVRLVFSGAFETGIGTCHVARLSHEFSPGAPVGIDGYSWLVEDILHPRLQMKTGNLRVSQPPRIRWQQLEELTL